MNEIYNFSPGPGVLPQEILLQAQSELLNYRGCGSSIMEISHRSSIFEELLLSTQGKVRQLLDVPDNYKILFMHGGAQGHFSFIPMNLKRNQTCCANYIISGRWSQIAAQYASRYLKLHTVNLMGNMDLVFDDIFDCQENAIYTYYCSNESVHGVSIPYTQAMRGKNHIPVVADATSSLGACHIDVTNHGVIFASTQKNLGIAGLTVVIIRDDLLNSDSSIVPEVFNYSLQSINNSLVNTIPVFNVYMLNLMVNWLLNNGGVGHFHSNNHKRANELYDFIDNSNGFYSNWVQKEFRSVINVPFYLTTEELLGKFLSMADMRGLKYLKGHKAAGGVRASLYNAMPNAGVECLLDFMQYFMNHN